MAHPIALFFHCFFKIAAMVWYLICELVNGNSFVVNFVVSIVLLALDFWTVKNVTGRILVGLRWWNEANDSGSAWRFESLPEGAREINGKEKRIFWIMLVVGPIGWVGLGIGTFFSLSWDYLIIPIIGILFTSSNLFGYFKCSREAKQQLSDMTNTMVQGALRQGLNNAISRV